MKYPHNKCRSHDAGKVVEKIIKILNPSSEISNVKEFYNDTIEFTMDGERYTLSVGFLNPDLRTRRMVEEDERMQKEAEMSNEEYEEMINKEIAKIAEIETYNEAMRVENLKNWIKS